MKIPTLYPIVNVTPKSDFDKALSYAQTLLRSNANILQLRFKGVSRDDTLLLAKEVVAFKNSQVKNALILINDSIEIAEASQADGVHLGQTDEPPSLARKILGSQAIIGFSTHSLSQAEAADLNSVSYIALGPIFSSATKSGHAPEVGLETLKKVCTRLPIPVVAIGGISIENVKSVYLQGASSVAVINDLENAKDVKERLSLYENAYVSARQDL